MPEWRQRNAVLVRSTSTHVAAALGVVVLALPRWALAQDLWQPPDPWDPARTQSGVASPEVVPTDSTPEAIAQSDLSQSEATPPADAPANSTPPQSARGDDPPPDTGGDAWTLVMPTRIRIESPEEGLELRLWRVTLPGQYQRPFWSDDGRRLCWTPCTLVMPSGTYRLGIDHRYEFDVVADGDPLSLRVTAANEAMWQAGMWMAIAGGSQFVAAMVLDLVLAGLQCAFAETSDEYGRRTGPSYDECLIGGLPGAFFGISIVGLGVALTGLGLLLGGDGSVEELPDDFQAEPPGDTFVHRPGTPFFAETMRLPVVNGSRPDSCGRGIRTGLPWSSETVPGRHFVADRDGVAGLR